RPSTRSVGGYSKRNLGYYLDDVIHFLMWFILLLLQKGLIAIVLKVNCVIWIKSLHSQLCCL
ncbi:MAG TPA: hypothetical protein VFH25_01765, partial [Nitrososphaeraceae archaeon]|nr:hypothetical protein [Nitrososphaeraceae archaeon]